MRKHNTRVGCTRETPCTHCANLLSFFDRAPEVFFSEWDAARASREAARRVQTHPDQDDAPRPACPAATTCATARLETPPTTAAPPAKRACFAVLAVMAIVTVVVVGGSVEGGGFVSPSTGDDGISNSSFVSTALSRTTSEPLSCVRKVKKICRLCGTCYWNDCSRREKFCFKECTENNAIRLEAAGCIWAASPWPNSGTDHGPKDHAFHMQGDLVTFIFTIYVWASFLGISCLLCRRCDEGGSTVLVPLKTIGPSSDGQSPGNPSVRAKSQLANPSALSALVGNEQPDERRKSMVWTLLCCECGIVPWAMTIIITCGFVFLTVAIVSTMSFTSFFQEVWNYPGFSGFMLAVMFVERVVLHIAVPIFLVRFRQLQHRQYLWALWLLGLVLGGVAIIPGYHPPNGSFHLSGSTGHTIHLGRRSEAVIMAIFLIVSVLTYRALCAAQRQARLEQQGD